MGILGGLFGGLFRAAARIVMPGIVRVTRSVAGVVRRLEALALTYTPEEVMRGDIRRAVREMDNEPLWRMLPGSIRPNRELFIDWEFRAPYRYAYKMRGTFRDPATGARWTETITVTSDERLSPDEVAEAASPAVSESKGIARVEVVRSRMIAGYHDPRETW